MLERMLDFSPLLVDVRCCWNSATDHEEPMKAVVYDTYDSRDVLELKEIDEPGEVMQR